MCDSVPVEVELTEDDIPGASLGIRKPHELKVPELKRWLACRGASRSGKKAALIERVNDYIRSGSAKRLVDPDREIHLQLKKRHLGVFPGASTCGQPPKVAAVLQ